MTAVFKKPEALSHRREILLSSEAQEKESRISRYQVLTIRDKSPKTCLQREWELPHPPSIVGNVHAKEGTTARNIGGLWILVEAGPRSVLSILESCKLKLLASSSAYSDWQSLLLEDHPHPFPSPSKGDSYKPRQKPWMRGQKSRMESRTESRWLWVELIRQTKAFKPISEVCFPIPRPSMIFNKPQ